MIFVLNLIRLYHLPHHLSRYLESLKLKCSRWKWSHTKWPSFFLQSQLTVSFYKMLPVAELFCPGWKTHRTGSSLNGCLCFIQTQEDDHHVPTQHNEALTRLTNRESRNSQNCFINSCIIFTLQWGKTGPCILYDGILVWIRINQMIF